MMALPRRSLGIALSGVFFAATAQAQSVQVADAENAQTWLVELSNSPTADGTSASALKSEKAAFRAAAAQAGIKMQERYVFDTLWNGISVRADASQVGAIARLPGVKNVWRSISLSLPPTSPAEPELATALTMTGADVAQSELGYTGAGVRVGIIDTGLDYKHPDLGACDKVGPNCRGLQQAGAAWHRGRRLIRQQRRQRPLLGRRARRGREGDRRGVVRQHVHQRGQLLQRQRHHRTDRLPAGNRLAGGPDVRVPDDGAHRHHDHHRRCLRHGAESEPRGQGGADPPRHLQLLPEGAFRAALRRGGGGPLQQRRRRGEPDGRG